MLPVDVNVERVLRRTGATFTGAAAQALMDLGATVCLARVPRCPVCPLVARCPSVGTRDEPRAQAEPVRGVVPAAAAETLRRVADGGRPVAALEPAVVDALARDGLVVVADGFARLPGA